MSEAAVCERGADRKTKLKLMEKDNVHFHFFGFNFFSWYFSKKAIFHFLTKLSGLLLSG